MMTLTPNPAVSFDYSMRVRLDVGVVRVLCVCCVIFDFFVSFCYLFCFVFSVIFVGMWSSRLSWLAFPCRLLHRPRVAMPASAEPLSCVGLSSVYGMLLDLLKVMEDAST